MINRWAFALGMACATAFGVFLLPFLLPPTPLQAVSAANVAGFNNRVALLAVLGLVLLVLLVARRGHNCIPLPAVDTRSKRPLYWVFWTMLILLWVAGNSTLAYLSDFRFSSEARYYIEQSMKASLYHLKLYKDLEFAYGPLLLYPILWLRPLFSHARHPIQAAYAVVLVAQAAIGLASLAYVLERLPITPALRRWLFPCFALLSTGWSLNYTHFRFATPAAAVLLCAQQSRLARYFPYLAAMQLLTLGISPEIGIAFAFAMACHSCVQFFSTGRTSWLITVPVLLVAAALFMGMVGWAYLDILRQFSGGVFHLIVEPQPHIVLLLVAVIWLAPLTVLSSLCEPAQPGIIAALFAFGIALLPASLGRADVGHVFYNGLALLLLASIPVGLWRLRYQAVWVGALYLALGVGLIYPCRLTLSFFHHVVKIAYLRGLPHGILGHHFHRAEQFAQMNPQYEEPIDLSRLRAVTGGEPVSTPEPLQPLAEEQLLSAQAVVPARYVPGVNEFTISSEHRAIADMNRAHWALLPPGKVSNVYETPEMMQFVPGFPYPYRSHRAPFQWGRLLQKNIEENWEPYMTLDGYVLYHRRSAGEIAPKLTESDPGGVKPTASAPKNKPFQPS